MIVQIYEIQTPEEAGRCIELGVDHVGSVLLSEAAWEQPGIKEIIRESERTRAKNAIIPLFNKRDAVFRVLDYYRPHFIHFCETLTDGQGREADLNPLISLQSTLKERYPEVGIIRSLPLPTQGSALDFPTLTIANAFEPVTDLFLTDTWLGQEPVEGFIGITGRTCDWNMAKDLVCQSRIPVILGGGLSPENVYGALAQVGASGADSCTQTNMRDREGKPVRFRKDFDRVKIFVEEARRAEKDALSLT
jgi:phosphoribosylanthranilate isomerase